MGLFSFIKDAGAKLIGSDDVTRSEKLTEEIIGTGLSVENFKAVITEEKVSVYGLAKSQAVKEKIILMVGNKDGVSEVDDNMTFEKPKVETVETPEVEEVVEFTPKFYTVVKGDTLGKIAKEFYGNAMKYPEIFEANKPMLKSADLIYPGQTLRIPELDN